MNGTEQLYERLAAAASLEGPDAAVRITASYEPAGGASEKISPPTYPVGDKTKPPYLLEQRWEGDKQVEVVLVDSRQAQANRCEEALQDDVDAGRLALPHLALATEVHGTAIRITSLQAPHRSRDAYFRDAAADDGDLFDRTPVGAALRDARPEDASPLYRHSPADLVYGVWDSHRGLRLAPRFPRVYTSEMVGWHAAVGQRAAGRFDLYVSGGRKVAGGNDNWQPGDGKKGKRMSELGHGSIPPSPSKKDGTLLPGGVHVQRISRAGSLGFAGLARVRLGALDAAGHRAARAVLAALALLGDRLAFGRAGVFLRSGADLVLVEESMAWVGRGAEEPLALSIDDARELFELAVARAAAAGAGWAPGAVQVRPQPKLQAMLEEAYFKSLAEED
ncbi:MAG: type I-G CRISPR-associated RAMP protein Csb1/Cas7g [Acidimicrobiales bacterium]